MLLLDLLFRDALVFGYDCLPLDLYMILATLIKDRIARYNLTVNNSSGRQDPLVVDISKNALICGASHQFLRTCSVSKDGDYTLIKHF